MLREHVSNIVGLGSKEEMFWIYTSTIIAAMADDRLFRDGAIEPSKNGSMNIDGPSVILDLYMPMRVSEP